jgi:hypothetical protein
MSHPQGENLMNFISQLSMSSIVDDFDYNSEEDEDYVIDNNLLLDDEDDEENSSEADLSAGGTSSAKRKRKQPQLTLQDKIAAGARKRTALSQKKSKFHLGAAVVSDEEEEEINNNSAANQRVKTKDDVINPSEETKEIPVENESNSQPKSNKSDKQTSIVQLNSPQLNDNSAACPPVTAADVGAPQQFNSRTSTTNHSPKNNNLSLAEMMFSYNKPKPKQPTKSKIINFWDTEIDSLAASSTDPPSAAAKPSSALDSLLASIPDTVSAVKVPTNTSAANDSALSSSGKLLSTNEITVKELSRFAGETIEVTKTMVKGSAAEKRYSAGRKDNLDQILASLTGKKSLNTLDKTKLDWEKDKGLEGDAEQLKQFTKNGFVAKQQFLVQADFVQYENLKAMKKQAGKKSINYSEIE